MGFLDKLKSMFSGKPDEVKSGIDKSSDVVEDKVGPEHADKVEDVADKAKDAVDKLAGEADTATGQVHGCRRSRPRTRQRMPRTLSTRLPIRRSAPTRQLPDCRDTSRPAGADESRRAARCRGRRAPRSATT